MVNKRMVRVLVFMTLLFVSLIGYLTYFELLQRAKVSQNPYNKRQWAYEADTLRGDITDRNGVVLAHSDGETRLYDHGALYSHVIGYNSKIYGKALLENKYNNLLLGRDSISEVFNLGGSRNGYDLRLTIDHGLQKKGSQLLGNRNGSIVAMVPKTGELLALVSKPDFDPSDKALSEHWQELTERKDAPLLPRATGGLYAPGSTFKIITAAAAIEAGLGGMEFMDYGSIAIGGTTFDNFGKQAYGKLDLTRGFSLSSNALFCHLGENLGGEALKTMAQRFGFDKDTGLDIPSQKSRFAASLSSLEDSAAAAIGQGDTLATPLQMAMTAAAIANGGVIMRPYLMQRALTPGGAVVQETRPQALHRAVSSSTASAIGAMMAESVKSGTGKSAALSHVTVAGKTGTAENELLGREKNKEHTWFVAYAPAEDPEIVVAVMLEYSGGSGGSVAAPIAKAFLSEYFSR